MKRIVVYFGDPFLFVFVYLHLLGFGFCCVFLFGIMGADAVSECSLPCVLRGSKSN
jgi:hypothetical protein